MWSHRCKADGLTLGHDDGTSHTQRIRCAACGRADDESVCLIGRQVFIVDVRMDGDHRRDIMLQDCNLVQRKGVVLQFHLVTGDVQHAVGFHPEVASVDVRHCLLDVVGRETGQKTQSACVDADDGDFFVTHTTCHIQEGAVATHAHYVVSRELVVSDDLTFWHMNLEVVAQKEEKRFGHSKFRFSFSSNSEEFLHGSTLSLLMYVAKEGKLELFSHI